MIYVFIILLSLLTQYTAIFLIVYIKSIKAFSDRHAVYDYIITLGCPYNAAPGSQYQNRVRKTAEYLNENKNAVAILSGACVKSGQKKSEAEYMFESLTSLGISPDRLITETKATNTYENLIFSKEITDSAAPNTSAGVITNRYHLVRTAIIAQSINYNVGFIPAKDPVKLIKAYMREYFVFPLTLINVYKRKNHK